MSTAVNTEALVRQVDVSDDKITAYLMDGRVISVPLAWSWRLSEATPAQRQNFRIIDDGQGVHWPDVDEDISVEGLLAGRASGESQASLDKWLRSRQQTG